jgi:hypothetical protein
MFAACGGETSDTPNEPASSLSELGVAINSIETDECPNVKVHVSITDENNQLIKDNPSLIVTLYEDGAEQTNNFSTEWQGDTWKPISVVFAMDYSPSMDDSREAMENGVKSFIDAMKPGDKAAIIKFYYMPQQMIGLTSDKTALYNAITEPPSDRGYTNIYDAVYDAVGVLAGVEGRLAAILFTDGRHNPSPEYPTLYTLEQAVDYALQQKVPVYSIGLNLLNDNEIRYISEETGGLYYGVFDSSVLDDVYLSLHELLQQEHLILYTSDVPDGLEHSIQIFAAYGGMTGDSAVQNQILCTSP